MWYAGGDEMRSASHPVHLSAAMGHGCGMNVVGSGGPLLSVLSGRQSRGEFESDDVQSVLSDLVQRFGRPTQCAGRFDGLDVQWYAESRVVTLCVRAGGRIQLASDRCGSSGRGPNSVGADEQCLWRYQRGGPFRPPPATSVAPDWEQLQSGLESLLGSWSQCLEILFGDSDAGFVIDHGDGQLILMVCASDDIAVFADRRDGTDSDGALLAAMMARGWSSFIPVLSWWDAYYDRTAVGAAAAARLVVAELKARGVASPGSLCLERVSLGDDGRLDVPGARIATRACA